MNIHRIELDDQELAETIASLECQLECSKEVLIEVQNDGTAKEIEAQEEHCEVLRQLLLRLHAEIKREESADPG